MASIAVGQVVVVYDGTVRPPKHKRLLCVCAGGGLFLRINSNPHFRPHMPIAVADNRGCLDHDSYVELRGLLDLDLNDLLEKITDGDAKILGHIGAETAALLVQHVQAAVTLTRIEKITICANFAGLIQP